MNITVETSHKLVSRTGEPDDVSRPTMTSRSSMHEGTNMAASPAPDGTRMGLSLKAVLDQSTVCAAARRRRVTPWDVEATQPVWRPTA